MDNNLANREQKTEQSTLERNVNTEPLEKKSNLEKRPNNHSDGSVKNKYSKGDVDTKNNSSSKCENHRGARNRSYWYSWCQKYREKESDTTWEPQLWPQICPYPFCPTYRQVSRLTAFVLIGSLSYVVIYALLGETAAPKGKLYSLIILTLCSYLGGYLVSLIRLPALVGMLFVGIIFQNTGVVNIDESYSEMCAHLRSAALVIILIRAGLDLEPDAMRRLKITVLKLSLGPWFVEVMAVAVMVYYFIGFPWWWAFLLGIIVAAVAPAVVVSCIFRLRTKGYGVSKGIPTLILASSSICDSTSVAVFGIVKSMMFTEESLASQVMIGPISIIGGVGCGILWGYLARYIPEKQDPFVVPLRVLLLLTGGMVSVFGSDLIGYGGAGPLSCVTAAFVSIYFWTKQGWDIEENPAATAFEIFWMMFEPVLFGVTGTQLKLADLHEDVVIISVAILLAAILIRILATIVLGIGSGLNVKEKLFVALSLIPKATVQAALGPITLAVVAEDSVEHTYARRILMISLLSILLATPIGALSMSITGKWLLTKTKFPELNLKNHRASIRDIIITNFSEADNELGTAVQA